MGPRNPTPGDLMEGTGLEQCTLLCMPYCRGVLGGGQGVYDVTVGPPWPMSQAFSQDCGESTESAETPLPLIP